MLAGPAVDPQVFSVPQPDLDTGDGFRLRPWSPGDARTVRGVYADPAVQRWHVRTLASDDEARDVVEGWAARWGEAAGASWAVVDGAGALCGRVALREISLHDGSAEVAYWTVAEARGRRVAPRALRTVTRWAFGAGFHRLWLEHSVRNAASCRAAVAAGYGPEGVRRSAVLHADGWHDMHTHARVVTDPAPPSLEQSPPG
jgi:ribosomal-protein-alanine N-acetyltransferase